MARAATELTILLRPDLATTYAIRTRPSYEPSLCSSFLAQDIYCEKVRSPVRTVSLAWLRSWTGITVRRHLLRSLEFEGIPRHSVGYAGEAVEVEMVST